MKACIPFALSSGEFGWCCGGVFVRSPLLPLFPLTTLSPPLFYNVYLLYPSTEIEGGISAILKVQAVAFLGEYEGWGGTYVCVFISTIPTETPPLNTRPPPRLSPVFVSHPTLPLQDGKPLAHPSVARITAEGEGVRGWRLCVPMICALLFCPSSLSFTSAFLVLLSPSLPLSLPAPSPPPCSPCAMLYVVPDARSAK